MSKKVLITGWFSTFGDVECLGIISRWLDQLGFSYDAGPYSEKIRKTLPGACDPRKVNPQLYSHLLVVCGPCWQDLFREKHKIDLTRFDHCVKVGINLSMLEPLEEWNPFDFLIERDSNRMRNPDITFGETTSEVPVVGRCVIHKQQEYGERQRHDLGIGSIDDLIERRGLAVIDIDTRWPPHKNTAGQKNLSEMISIMKRVDVVLTNRLHGLVFAVKSGVPIIAIDSIAGGDKVMAQARTIGWPKAIEADNVTPEWMDRALDWCLTSEAREMTETCCKTVAEPLAKIQESFLSAMTAEITPSPVSGYGKPVHPERWFRRWFRTRK